MPQRDDITTGDDGSYANGRPINVPGSAGALFGTASLPAETRHPAPPPVSFLAIGIVHALLGFLATMSFPLICLGVCFAISMTQPMYGLSTGDLDYQIPVVILVSLVALNAVLAFALPFGCGLIRRRQSAIRGTKVTAILTLCLSSNISFLGVFSGVSGFHLLSLVLFVAIPSAVYLSSSFYLWFLTRRWF